MFILINTAFEKVISLPLCKQKRLTSSSAAHTSNYHAEEGAAKSTALCSSAPKDLSEHPGKTPVKLSWSSANLPQTPLPQPACWADNFKASLWGMGLWASPQISKFRGKTQAYPSNPLSVVIKSKVTGEVLSLPPFRLTPPTQLNYKNLLILS